MLEFLKTLELIDGFEIVASEADVLKVLVDTSELLELIDFKSIVANIDLLSASSYTRSSDSSCGRLSKDPSLQLAKDKDFSLGMLSI